MSINLTLEGTFDLTKDLVATLLWTLSSGAKLVAKPREGLEFQIESPLLMVSGSYCTLGQAEATDYGAKFDGSDRIGHVSFGVVDKERAAEAYDLVVGCTNAVLGASTSEMMLLFDTGQPFLHRTGDDLKLFLETDGENAFWKNGERSKRITEKSRFVRWRD